MAGGGVTVDVVHDAHCPVFLQKEHCPRQRPTDATLVRLLGRDKRDKIILLFEDWVASEDSV